MDEQVHEAPWPIILFMDEHVHEAPWPIILFPIILFPIILFPIILFPSRPACLSGPHHLFPAPYQRNYPAVP